MKKIFFILFVSLPLLIAAQPKVDTRIVRFFPIVTASDTTTAGLAKMWYDYDTDAFRVMLEDGTKFTLGSGSGSGGGPLTINNQTASYELVLADGTNTLVRMDVPGANTVTVPANTDVAYPIGTTITLEQITGTTTVVADPGVTINGSSGTLISPGVKLPMVLVQTAIDVWDLWNGSPPLTVSNGLTGTPTTIQLGGALTGTTTISGAQTLNFTNNSSIFSSGTFNLRNPANTFNYNFVSGAIVADRTISLPVASAGSTLMLQQGGSSAGRVPFMLDATGVYSSTTAFLWGGSELAITAQLLCTSTASRPALRIGGTGAALTTDPTLLQDGDWWYRTDLDQYSGRANGATVRFAPLSGTVATNEFVKYNGTNMIASGLFQAGSAGDFDLGGASVAGAVRQISAAGSASEIDVVIASKPSSGQMSFAITPSIDAFEFDFKTFGGGIFFQGTSATAVQIFSPSANDIKIGGTNIGASGALDITIESNNGTPDGDIIIETLDGTGTFKLNSGANEQMGTATLVGGTVTVNNTKVTANSLIWPTHRTAGGTLGILSYTIVAGTSFTVTSTSGTDTSTINWIIIEPN